METEIGYYEPEREIDLFPDEDLKGGMRNIWDHLSCQWPLSLCCWTYDNNCLRSSAGESYEEI